MATLFKRKGIWYINYSLSGRQLRKSTRTSNKKLAEIALKEIELRLFKGDISSRTSAEIPLFTTLFHQYLVFLEENRSRGYTEHVRWYLTKWSEYFVNCGVRKPSDITAHCIEQFLMDNLKGRSGKTRKEYLASLKAVLNKAVKMGQINSNPANAVVSPIVDVRKVRFITKKEIHQLLRVAPTDLATAITILVNTGLRLGELWALRWIDVDFRSKQLLVRAYDGFTPKGKRDRSVPMNEPCLRVIRKLDGIRKTDQVHVYRLLSSDRYLSKKFGKLSTKVGLNMRLHDLRHTFASHLVMSGTPLPVVQELLGHAQISTTMIYAHLAPNIHRREVEKLQF